VSFADPGWIACAGWNAGVWYRQELQISSTEALREGVVAKVLSSPAFTERTEQACFHPPPSGKQLNRSLLKSTLNRDSIYKTALNGKSPRNSW
jgi:hypothetical protein